jgi:hypothetical protein
MSWIAMATEAAATIVMALFVPALLIAFGAGTAADETAAKPRGKCNICRTKKIGTTAQDGLAYDMDNLCLRCREQRRSADKSAEERRLLGAQKKADHEVGSKQKNGSANHQGKAAVEAHAAEVKEVKAVHVSAAKSKLTQAQAGLPARGRAVRANCGASRYSRAAQAACGECCMCRLASSGGWETPPTCVPRGMTASQFLAASCPTTFMMGIPQHIQINQDYVDWLMNHFQAPQRFHHDMLLLGTLVRLKFPDVRVVA